MTDDLGDAPTKPLPSQADPNAPTEQFTAPIETPAAAKKSVRWMPWLLIGAAAVILLLAVLILPRLPSAPTLPEDQPVAPVETPVAPEQPAVEPPPAPVAPPADPDPVPSETPVETPPPPVDPPVDPPAEPEPVPTA